MVMVVMIMVVAVIVAGLRRSLPILTPDNGGSVGAELTVHVSATVFSFGQPFQEGFDQ